MVECSIVQTRSSIWWLKGYTVGGHIRFTRKLHTLVLCLVLSRFFGFKSSEHHWAWVNRTRGPRFSLGDPPDSPENHENHYEIMVFGSRRGSPCVPHVRAVILVLGTLPPTQFSWFSVLDQYYSAEENIFSRHDSLKISIQMAFRAQIQNPREKSVWKTDPMVFELQILRSWWPKREISKPFWHFWHCTLTLTMSGLFVRCSGLFCVFLKERLVVLVCLAPNGAIQPRLVVFTRLKTRSTT